MDAIEHAKALISRLSTTKPDLTSIRASAKETGKSQEIAQYLWKHGGTESKLPSLLVLELKATDPGLVETLITDIAAADKADQRQLCDWLMANVLMYKASLKKEALKWISERSSIKRRIFWSVRARSVRTEDHELNQELLGFLEQNMALEEEMVQENMNWCAAQIGIADEKLHSRCVRLRENLGLYKDYPVSKGCTSPYLPIWIESIVGKKSKLNAAPHSL